MALSMAREDCHTALVWPRYLETASDAEIPSYQARSAAREAVSGMDADDEVASGMCLGMFFTKSSLPAKGIYCDKNDYRNTRVPGTKGGRPPLAVETMLRIHFIQQWFNLSDPAMEEELYNMALFREFVGSDAWEDNLPGSQWTYRSS